MRLFTADSLYEQNEKNMSFPLF